MGRTEVLPNITKEKSTKNTSIVNLILAGGHGTRLAPLSAPETPKQFLKLFSNQTVFSETLDRMFRVSEDFVIVANKTMEKLILDDINTFQGKVQLLLEPVSRNTGPAVAYGVKDLDPETIVVMSPSDHYIKNDDKFYNAIDKAIKLADTGMIVCLSVRADRPDSNFGYVRENQFVEKPNYIEASKLLNRGFQWNTGIYVFKIKTFLDVLAKENEEIISNVKSNDSFDKCPKISFDKLVSEQTSCITNVKTRITWNDVGTFKGLYEVIATTALNGLEYSKRPWGEYQVIRDDDIFKMKKLTIDDGQSISLQYHQHRKEIWYILNGSGTYINQTAKDNIESNYYKPGDLIEIPVGNIHKIKADYKTQVFEIQIGDYFGEDDIIRLEDQYGRIKGDV